MADFLLVTANHKEFVPLKETFGAQRIPQSTPEILRYYEASISLANGASYRLILTWLGQGSIRAGARLSYAIAGWKPRYVIMTGIAAGIPNRRRRLCDLLVAAEIVDASEWKIVPNGEQLRQRVHQCDAQLVHLLEDCIPPAPKVKIHVGTIISQTDLVKSAKYRTSLVKLVRGFQDPKFSPIVGLEMEGSAVAEAASAVSGGLHPGVLLIKGLVDFANFGKNDDVQVSAAHEAAQFAKYFIAQGPVASLNLPVTTLDGVEAISEKHCFQPEFWNLLLLQAQERIDIAGHALNKWCEQQYAETFARSILTLVRRRKTVRLLVLHPQGSAQRRLSEAQGLGPSGYKKRILRTLAFLKTYVVEKVSETQRRFVDVRWSRNGDLPYMLVATDKSIVVSPYLAKRSSSDNILLVLRPGTPHACAYTEDFEELFTSSPGVDWSRLGRVSR